VGAAAIHLSVVFHLMLLPQASAMNQPQSAFSAPLQESLVTLLAFDVEHCALIRNAADPNLFSSLVYRDVVLRIYTFIDQFGKPPGEHFPDLFEDILQGPDKDDYELYRGLIERVAEARHGINKEYVLSQLEGFVRRQKLLQGLIEAHEAVDAGQLEQAEVILEEALRSRLAMFKPGTTLKQVVRKLQLKDDPAMDCVKLNIPFLDERRLGPARKELSMMIAPAKRGKSWYLVHCGKQALLQRWKVLHITLEMNEDQTGQRYLQALYGLTRREAQSISIAKFDKDGLGRLQSIGMEPLAKRKSLGELETLKETQRKLDKLRVADNLMIKEFPTGRLTIQELKAYLDALERMHKFVPDLLIVDYADLMYVNSEFYRHEIGQIYKDLRGIGVERNIAITTASQANREGARARLTQDTHAAEDWSKIATADLVLTYSQTAEERLLGLARLFVSNARNDEDKFAVLATQAYAIGQFCLDAVWMSDSYWSMIEQTSKPYEDKAEKT
jgi:replicative DNA helicase